MVRESRSRQSGQIWSYKVYFSADVASSREISVKIVDVRDTTKIQVLEGHTKAVRAVTWCPDGQYVV